MATASQFESSHLKIKRAYRHIQEVEATFKSFLQTDFCRLVIEDDLKTGSQLIKAKSDHAPPPEISLMIGDAIHNLRSALDHAAVQIIHAIPGIGKEGRKQAAFPMAADRNNPGSHPAYGLIKKSFPDLANLLTDEIGIHDTGEPCLWTISGLDNIDKHNLLIAAVSVQELQGISLYDKAHNNRFSGITVRLNEGGTANLIQYGPGKLEITSKGQPAAAILFGKGQPLEGKAIIPSLLKLAELTSQAIKTLELFWFGEKPKGTEAPSIS